MRGLLSGVLVRQALRHLTRKLSVFLAGLVALLLAGLATPAAAHEMSMAELSLRELSRGEFIWHWGAGSTGESIARDLTPRWPGPCRVDGDSSLKCGSGGLTGSLQIDGVGQRYSAALVRVVWLDGQTRVYTLTAGQPSLYLHGSADDRRDGAEIFRAYTVLGFEHILSGVDHLLFVIGLLFLVGFNRQLVATITAFTVAHSLTLGLSVMGWLALRPAPVEACIALSIVLVAGEALRTRDTLARRWPALVAFVFGLVHGLGFAGALREIGLPEQHLPLALLSFNLGVEAGQLATLGLAWLFFLVKQCRVLRRQPGWGRFRQPALYGMGAVAAYWSCLRVVAILA